jgi:extracellular elastinolytic metalloproteinase
MNSRSRRTRVVTAGLALFAVALVPAIQQLPAVAASSPTTGQPGSVTPPEGGTLADPVPGLADLDLVGTVAPTLAQKTAAAALGDVQLRWSKTGTPASILPMKGTLGTASSTDPVVAARSWLAGHSTVLGISPLQVAGLQLVSSQKLAGSGARAVLFQQTFGGLAPAQGSLVTVGVADRKIAYVSSTLTRTTGTAPAATLSPLQGWVKAATDVGQGSRVPARLASITRTVAKQADGRWTKLAVPGFADVQYSRLRALALADGSVRPVIQANVVDGASAFGYTVLVDAVNGRTLLRTNQVDNASDAYPVNGTYTGTDCGTNPFEVTDALTKSITAVVASAVAADDLTVSILSPSGEVLVTGDLLSSPETATYSSSDIPAGVYSLKVCAYEGTAPVVGEYVGTVATSDTAAPGGSGAGGVAPLPKWRYFDANPALDFSPEVNAQDDATSVIGCWINPVTPDCTAPNGSLATTSSLGPWDTLAGVPTFTTIGNNANTHEAWVSPLTPGGLAQAPVSPTREYTTSFTDAWNDSGCARTNLVPGGNDIDAVTANLFVGHNQMHDWSYQLGFTETNSNMQTLNSGRGGAEGDPEIGNVQAGAILVPDPTGEVPLAGRDNANQITLQDGVPGVTNQYLFQPLAGAFYSPCADGSLDTSIFGHEYTHAISNRMIGGPNDGITSEQGGAMGESWGDLNAGEYMFANDYPTGGGAWAVGPYATGNPVTGIRDYAIDDNPLNYGSYGFDSTGAEVHADGEIWNGTMWEARQGLVDAWNDDFPVTDKGLQKKCSRTSGALPAELCPGNRRWIQLVFDSFLLQQGATSMLDARDAMLAADRMRFDGANQETLWAAFARRGMGADASIVDAEDTDPTPSFASPLGAGSPVTFTSTSPGTVYVGDFEARTTPVADTDAATDLADTTTFTPGTYKILFVSPTAGFRRLLVTVPSTGEAVVTKIDDADVNLAAAASGATIIGATAGSLNPAYLIDGTEATNWGGVTTDNVNVSNPSVAVDLGGDGAQLISSVNVSAMLSPVVAEPAEGADTDDATGSRFTALRKFAIETCVESCETEAATWTRVFTSADDAFPADVPRPVAPNEQLRSFALPEPVLASAVRLVTLENQCTGQVKYSDASGTYTDPATGQPALDLDSLNDTDCATGSDRGTIVHAAELQVFGSSAPVNGIGTGAPTTNGTGTGTPIAD